jgi:hypothetical protein
LALSGYVLAGGTLALVTTRPEDLRHPLVMAFAGGAISRTDVQSETTRVLANEPTPTGTGHRPLPERSFPEPGILAELSGYAGGNLHASPYGASASYGLGEVHWLAFDPSQSPAVDSPWVHIRLLDLIRRALERQSSALYRPGDEAGPSDQVRRHLDPSTSARWAIVVTTLLLCLYAIFAGPVSFGHFSRRGRPLTAYRILPLLSLATFVVVVGAPSTCPRRARSPSARSSPPA